MYADIMLVRENNSSLVNQFKRKMEAVFEMFDLGLIRYFLGIEINQFNYGIFISQEKFPFDLLKKFKLDMCNEAATPLALNE